MRFSLIYYSLLPRNNLKYFTGKHVHSQCYFAEHLSHFIFIGMQHDVIHPPDPFGLPLEYSLLPQELKKVGE